MVDTDFFAKSRPRILLKKKKNLINFFYLLFTIIIYYTFFFMKTYLANADLASLSCRYTLPDYHPLLTLIGVS
jgi:hypothetical protein